MRSLSRLLLVALVWLLTSCDQGPGGGRASDTVAKPNVVVAQVGDERITLSQFEAELARRSSGIPNAFDSRQQRVAVLEELVRRKAAWIRAREQKLDKDPQIRALVEQLVASRYIESGIAPDAVEAPAVTEAEIERHYNSNAATYRLPPAIRCGILTLRIGSKAEPEKRAALRSRAHDIREAAATADDAAFARLVQQHSEDQSTRYIGGDTGWLTESDAASRWPDEVVAAALRLDQPGQVAPPVETSSGFFIVRLTERTNGGLRPLAEVREAIRYQLARSRQHQREQAFFEEMKRGLKIHINREAIDALPPPDSSTTAAVPQPPGG